MTDQGIKNELKRIFNVALSAFPPETQKLLLNKAFIAGGCFISIYHRENPNDIDIYFADEKAAKKFLELSHKFNKTELTRRRDSEQAVTYYLPHYGYTIQFITRYTGVPLEVISRFDFEHTHNYYIPKSDKIFIKNIGAMNNKDLIFNQNASHPVNALRRLSKFIGERKFNIDDEEYLKISMSIAKLDFSDEKVIKEQLTGMYTDSFRHKFNISTLSKKSEEEFKKELFKQQMDYEANDGF